VTPARLAVAAGIEPALSHLPQPAPEAQDLVPYDEAVQGVLTRSFEVAIAQGADMVDIPHVVKALTDRVPTMVLADSPASQQDTT